MVISDSNNQTNNLKKECIRQFDNCRYSAVSLYIWKKYARVWRAFFLISPIILGGFASSQLILESGPVGKTIGALCGLLAGMFPSVTKALNVDVHVEAIQRAATEFTNLRDRFRRAAAVSSLAPFDEFAAEVEALMDRMDAVRATAPPSPEWCFRSAQKKIGSGDYDFDIDLPETVPSRTRPASR